jgi:hypothetical protein
MKSIAIFMALIFTGMIFLVSPSLVLAKQDKTQIIILHTNNLNGKVIPCPT